MYEDLTNVMIIIVIVTTVIGNSNSKSIPPCHILPPSEIPWRLFLAVLQAQKGNTYFTELAERAENGNYE